MLTPKEMDSGGIAVFPLSIEQSALLESGYTSTGAVAANVTIALGFKPTGATTSPLNDMTSHYLLTIQKEGCTVKVWKQGVALANYGGSVGATYAEFLSNVLTVYSGSNKGYYSRLVIVEEVKTHLDFWEPASVVTGLWRPKKPYGVVLHTHLDFANAVDLGNDISGNNHDWALAGVQTLDTPTSNYATLNSLDSAKQTVTLYDGNVRWDASGLNRGIIRSTLSINGGKYYVEFTQLGINLVAGIGPYSGSTYNDAWNDREAYVYTDRTVDSVAGTVRVNESDEFYLPVGVAGDVFGMAVDGINKTIQFTRNGATYGGLHSYTSDEDLYVWIADVWTDDRSGSVNFGATGYKHTPPEGFKALCSNNLPAPTIRKSSSVVDVVLRTGESADRFLNRPTDASQVGYGSSVASHTTDGTVATSTSDATSFYYSHPALVPVWVRVDCQIPRTLVRYKVRSLTPGSPTAWQFQGSTDNVNWVTLDSQYGQTVDSIKEYTLANTAAYQYYRLYVTAVVQTGHPVVVDILEGYDDIPTKLFLPDMKGGADCIVSKVRAGNNTSWVVSDTMRGVDKQLYFDGDYAETLLPEMHTAFDSGSIAIGSRAEVNGNGYSLLDLVMAFGAEQGVQVIKVGPNNNAAILSIPHSLGKAPTFILGKSLGISGWATWHKDLPAQHLLYLDKVHAASIDTGSPPAAFVNVNASSFDVQNWNRMIGADKEGIFYIFTDSDIFKAFSYIGNLNIDGPFVDLGGKPLSVPFWKNADTASEWLNVDAVRDVANPVVHALRPDTSDTESVGTAAYQLSFVSQGLKVANVNNTINGSGQLHVGLAILESKQYSNAI